MMIKLKAAAVLFALNIFAGTVVAQVVDSRQTAEPKSDEIYTEFVRLKYIGPCEVSRCYFGPRDEPKKPSRTDRFFTFLRAYMSERAELLMDCRSNTVIISDRFDKVALIKEFLTSMDREDMSVEEMIGEPKPAL